MRLRLFDLIAETLDDFLPNEVFVPPSGSWLAAAIR